MRVNSKVYHRRHGWGLVVGRAPDIPGALLVSFDNHSNRSLSKVVKESELSAKEGDDVDQRGPQPGCSSRISSGT